MKNYLNYLLFTLVCLLIFSCASTSLTESSVKKRRYNSGWHVDLGRHHNDSKVTKNSAPSKSFSAALDTTETEISDVPTQKSDNGISDNTVTAPSDVVPLVAVPVEEGKQEVIENKCDTIVFNDGKKILAKIAAVSQKKVSYHLCDNLDGPKFSHETSLINKLQFANGTKTVISDYYSFDAPEEKELEVAEEDKKYEVLSLLSLIFLGISPFLLLNGFWILTIPIALILGIIGLLRIKRYSKKFKGRWMALTGVIGAATFIILIAALIVAYITDVYNTY
jgi:hypothetical protein